MSESLRDTITNAVEQHTEAPVEAPTEVVEGVQDASIPGEGNTTPKPGRTAGRARDESGRLLPGKALKDSAGEPGKTASPTPNAEQVVAAPPPAEAKPRPQRPSSWKKDYWDHWEKLDPSVAEYINQREGEYAKGVSTYKTEFDRLKPLDEAMQEFLPTLQQFNMAPAAFISNMGRMYKELGTGSPEQRLSVFMKIAQDFQVPVQNLFQQGQDGRIYFNPQVKAYQPPQAAQQQPDVRQTVQEILAQERTHQTIAAFEAEAPQKYPHYDAVKQTMIGLLQAELATDLPDAYAQALALPRHSEIARSIKAQEEAEVIRKAAEEKAKAVARAKANVISPRTSTPTVSQGEKPKGVRPAIEDAWDKHVGGGRV